MGPTDELECTFDLVKGPDGSVLMRQGGSAVICTLNGPREAPHKAADKFAGLIKVCVNGSPSTNSRATHASLGSHLEMAVSGGVRLEMYPRSVLEIALCIMEEGPELFSCCANAISVLLLSSGIYLRGVIVAHSVEHPKGSGLCMDLVYLKREGQYAELFSRGPVLVESPLHAALPNLLATEEKMRFYVKKHAYARAPEDRPVLAPEPYK